MKWRALNAFAIRSHCGHWQISRTVHGDHDLYSLWRRDPESGGCVYVYTYPDAGQAKQRARDEEARR